jgi:HK97 family phage prohead protease
MSYEILAKDGRPILKDGDPVKAMDYTVEKIEQLDDTNKTFVAVASTEDEDRDKDIIRQDGWDLKNFKKNPMIPWSHDYWGVPIARSLRTWVDHDAKKLLFKPQFDSEDETSMKLFGKYKNGFLTSFSVGFRGIEFNYRDEEDRWWGGIEFLKQELLEISGVTIPANPNARTSFHGDVDVQNLLQMGYPQTFAETEEGLFYPVRELGEYVNPEIKIGDEAGVRIMYANSISEEDDGSTAVPVGYFFDTDFWKTGDIQPWIIDNAEVKYNHRYYDWRWIDDQKTWEVETQEEEKEIPIYDEPVKVEINITTTKKDDDDVTDDSIDDVEKTLKEYLDEVTEVMDKHLESISEGVTNALEKFLEGLSEIKSLLNEKIVDSDTDLDDNISNDDDLDTTDEDDKHDSKSDDEIEIDDSLLSPDNDKSNDDDVIELDDDLLSDKDVVQTAVKTGLNEKLKETLDEVKDSFKIDV